jgi:hypothetical protein
VDEATWQGCTNPFEMVQFLIDKVSVRKLRLLACGCCRRLWHALPDQRSRRAVNVLDRLADGLADEAEATRARRAATCAYRTSRHGPGSPATIASLAVRDAIAENWSGMLRWASVAEVWSCGGCHSEEEARQGAAAARARQAAVLREVVGNPFRPSLIAPAWLTPTVISLAQSAYEERHLPSGELDPVRLGILADALEEAGADAGLVGHLRGPGPHVRGCHVVDLLTGRE